MGTGSEIVTGIKSALIENKSGEWSERTELEWMARTFDIIGEKDWEQNARPQEVRGAELAAALAQKQYRMRFPRRLLLVSRGQTFRGRGTSGHYCLHSVIQWNFIRVTSRRSVTSKKCNCAMRAMRNWSFISAGLTSITRECGVSLPRSMSNTRGSTA